MSKLLEWFDRQCNQNKLIRRLYLFWSCAFVTCFAFSFPDTEAIKWIVGILTVPAAFYFKQRGDGK